MTSGARALIVGAAPLPGEEAFYGRLLGSAQRVIAADAAGEWCAALGRAPDVVVADFDSASPGAADRLRSAGVAVEEHPSAKDLSDLDLCLARARADGVSSVAFTAAFRGRLDHTLASLGTLARAADLRAVLVEPDLTGWALDSASRPEVEFSGREGMVFSVLSPGGVQGLGIEGAAYPLSDARLGPLDSLGLSNVCLGGEVRVRVGDGRAFVLLNGLPDADIHW